jgi:glycosyltransferase involved in cell wall biosynthesis
MDAVKILDEHVNDERVNIDGLIARADCARDQRDWDNAARHYRDALDVDGGMAHIWVQYGHALKESRRYDDAESAYQAALVIDNQADTHLQLGHLHKITGRRRDAEEDYLRALELAPGLSDAKEELARMGWAGARLRARVSQAGLAPASAEQAVIALELSDLLDHLEHTRYPTGIQRVQLGLGAAFAQSFDGERARFVYYDRWQSRFCEVSRQHVLGVADLVDSNAHNDEERREFMRKLKAEILDAPAFDFPPGAYLVNVGTSWGFLNYFHSIREAKRRSQIRYLPLVHDCIPLLFPEFCGIGLVPDFINWITLMIEHADVILTNSENTRKDVVKTADELGVSMPSTATLYLNGEYGDRAENVSVETERATRAALAAHNLDVGDYVLLVSTIEPRKNHALVLNAWSHMLKTRPPGSVPRLVCVGGSGWMNDAFHQQLQRDRALRDRVTVVCNVSDQVLKALYKRCLFTIFPSLYEGWGLPISEALAYGKVPLVSRISSHPEAGGDLAVYFDPGSEADFKGRLKALIDDAGMRREREEKIAKASPLRPWRDIAKEVFLVAENHRAKAPAGAAEAAHGLPALICGRYYSFARNQAASLQMLEYSGDKFRTGPGWHAPEPFGCWIRGATGDLAFSLAHEQGDDFLVYLHWMGSPNIENVFTLSLPPGSWTKRIHTPSGAQRWEAIALRFGPGSTRDVRVRIAAEAVDDFGKATEGQDPRQASGGAKGIYVCRASDGVQRVAIIEAIQFGDLSLIARRFPASTAP